jgi:pSer/pThr/pTyr-binding forkhead associated (FHA) protein
MPKLTLKYGDRILREIALDANPVTIGRLLDNAVVIDNQAVSGHHARVSAAGKDFVVEDLESTNGTFVNEAPVKRHTLREGDVVLIGKHQLVFDLADVAESRDRPGGRAPVQDLGGTVFLETKAQKELMDRIAAGSRSRREGGAGSAGASASAASPAPAAPGHAAILTLLSGATDQFEYTLDAQSCLIGKSAAAAVRLRGWFKPKEAAAITRRGRGFVLTPLRGKTRINGQPVIETTELGDGDIIEVSRVTLQFTQRS